MSFTSKCIPDEEIALRIAYASGRRIFLSSRVPPCPECSISTDYFDIPEPQNVHLKDYIDVSPALWRCRQCGLEFLMEPPVP